MKPIKGFALAVLLAATTTQAIARDYQVELLVFSNQTAATLDDEIWPAIDALPDRQARQLGYNESNPANTPYTRLPKSAMQLSNKQASLRRSPEYRVLFHETWIQPVGTDRQAKAIRIKGGDILDNGLYELDGFVTISRGRYLHFRTELFHSRQLSPDEFQMLLRAEPEAEQADEEAPSVEQQPLNQEGDTGNSANGNRYLTTQTVIPDFLTVEMNSARRMRSKELHYLDHPLFGALVLITPVEE